MKTLEYLGQGRYHTVSSMPCQDNLITCKAGSGRRIFSVSDGCSSSKYSDVGSATVVSGIAEFFAEGQELSDSDELKGTLLKFLDSKLKEKANELAGGDISELFATLVFAVCDGEKLLTGHIGDGALLCFDEDGAFFVSDPENAGAANVTYFVGSSSAYRHFHLKLVDIGKENTLRNLILFSDGPQKAFAEIGRGSITQGVNGLIRAVREGSVSDCKALKEYLFDKVINSIYDVDDDWSLILFDALLPEAQEKFSGKAECMTLEYYEKYLIRNPDSAIFTVPRINELRARLSMEPISFPDTQQENTAPSSALEKEPAHYENEGEASLPCEEETEDTEEIEDSYDGSGAPLEFINRFNNVLKESERQAGLPQTPDNIIIRDIPKEETTEPFADNNSEKEEINEFLDDFMQSLNELIDAPRAEKPEARADRDEKNEVSTADTDIRSFIGEIDARANALQREMAERQAEQDKKTENKKNAPPIMVVEAGNATEKKKHPTDKPKKGDKAPNFTKSAPENSRRDSMIFTPGDKSSLFAPDENNIYDTAFDDYEEEDTGGLKKFFAKNLGKIKASFDRIKDYEGERFDEEEYEEEYFEEEED